MEKSEFFSYSWHIDEEESERTVIRVYGLNSKNESVCVIVNNFLPYVYLELPQNIEWDDSRASLIASKLNNMLQERKPVTYELVFKKKLYYANIDAKKKRRLYPYIRCCCSHPEDIRQLGFKIRRPINIPGIGAFTLKMHEHNANAITQLTSLQKLPTAGWISFLGKRIKGDDQVSHCKYEYIVKWENMTEKPSTTVARPLLMGYDIEVNSSIPSSMPKAHRPQDKIFQISCVFSRQGGKPDSYERYLLTLGEPDIDVLGENIEALLFETESDLLLGFVDLIQEKQPNIIIGYNIFGFDIPYMIERAKTEFCMYDFDRQGMLKYSHAKERTIEWSSSAYKNQSFQFLDAEGRIFVDLLPLVKRDYKMSNYQLKTIASHFLKDMTKDPLDHKAIFKCYRLGMKGGQKGKKAISLVGKYCVKDSELVVRLFETLTTWIALCEMSKVTNVPIFQLYTQGQQLKVFSQAYKKCTHENIVVEKDGYITKEHDHYVGATVFPPIPGVYDKVVPFDFCLAGDTLISLANGCSKRIDSFYTDEIVLGTENNVLNNYTTVNDLQKKGLRETVKIWFQDGTTITATPDHKFMTDDGEWCKACDLENKYVRCGIQYTEDKKCSLEEDWTLTFGEYTLDMQTNREKSLAFARILGYILSDGSIYTTTSKLGYTRLCAEVAFGTLLDAENFKLDLGKFCANDVAIRKRSRGIKGTTYCINIPAAMARNLHNIEDIVVGKRATQSMKLPKFLLEDGCPLSIVREFLGGLFGGDGSAPYFSSRNTFGPVSFKWTTIEKYKNSMETTILDLKKMLEKFDLDIRLMSPIKIQYRKGAIIPKDSLENPRWDYQINILEHHSKKFLTNIGFRYCVNKSLRLTAVASYQTMQEKTREQHGLVLKKTIDIVEKLRVTTREALDIARQEIFQNQPIINEYSLSSVKDIGYQKHEAIRHKDRPRKISLQSKKFPKPRQFLTETNTLNWFVHPTDPSKKIYAVSGDSTSIPCFRKKVIAVVPHDRQPVFDIEVSKAHNFLANGVIAHNCSLYPTTIIAYNISWDTLVEDEKIPDELCHVMEWDDHIGCIVEGTLVTVGEYCLPIEQLNEPRIVLAYNSDKKGLSYYKQTNFFNQGIKDCIELVFEDGTKLRCTPDHKILLSNGKWEEAGNINVNQDRVSVGYKPPYYKIDDKTGLTIDDFSFYGEKAIIFYKLLGLLITDGHVEHNRSTIYCGHKLDLANIIRDLDTILPNSYSISKQNYGWGVKILGKLGEVFRNLEGIVWGSKKGKRKFPKILDYASVEELKAFLSGVFGGDGHTFSPSIKSGQIGTICLSWSSEKESELTEIFIQLQKYLLLCGINSTISRNKNSTLINIIATDIIKFQDTIGFAYCVHKSMRLEAGCSYLRLRQEVWEQQRYLVEEVRKLKKNMTIENALQKAIENLHQNYPVYNFYYANPTKCQIIELLRSRRKNIKPMFSKQYFPTYTEYIKSIGSEDLFNSYAVKADSDVLPYLSKKVIYIKNIGKQQVYDLEVADSHSFLANGIIVHNCSHDPKEIRKAELNKIIKEKDAELKELRKERDLKKNKDRKEEFKIAIADFIRSTKPYRDERSQLNKSKPKHIICQHRKYRWLKAPMGVLPEILTHLLDTRAATKKEMKTVKGKLKEMKEGSDEYAELSTYHDVLDQRQLALKLSANSGYGCLGVRRGYLPFMPGAMVTTYMGRKSIEKAAESIQKDWKGVLVYGDTDKFVGNRRR